MTCPLYIRGYFPIVFPQYILRSGLYHLKGERKFSYGFESARNENLLNAALNYNAIRFISLLSLPLSCTRNAKDIV